MCTNIKIQGKSWTFHRFSLACDTPEAEMVQAVLFSNNKEGFTLYARQKGLIHIVMYEGKTVVFRTIEHALSALTDVPHLNPEVVIDSSEWFLNDESPI